MCKLYFLQQIKKVKLSVDVWDEHLATNKIGKGIKKVTKGRLQKKKKI